ncbi:TetR/AcrR family transcriptional regulator [Streptomyces sp. NPDC091027]|uniref:TetR/AcrR family transcriptional regulator n=1 Tax=Streptomyces sp. NPDC091027 TaxID=3365971 RepID=UPI00381A4098
MRPSARTRILDAAVRVTERDGITALTLQSAAEEAGVTKPGLMYHFPTRQALLVAIQRHLTLRWESLLAEQLGRPPEAAGDREKVAAYVRVGSRLTAGRAELAFMAEHDPEVEAVWDDLLDRWVPTPVTAGPRDIDLLLARMAVDGLWMLHATSNARLTPAVRAALVARITALAEPRAVAGCPERTELPACTESPARAESPAPPRNAE